jgi:hypothetical protein
MGKPSNERKSQQNGAWEPVEKCRCTVGGAGEHWAGVQERQAEPGMQWVPRQSPVTSLCADDGLAERILQWKSFSICPIPGNRKMENNEGKRR